jgi:hypothetical protein
MKILKRLITRYKRGRAVRTAISELSKLSNRDLRDIGVSRCDIKFVARQAAEKQHNTMSFR